MPAPKLDVGRTLLNKPPVVSQVIRCIAVKQMTDDGIRAKEPAVIEAYLERAITIWSKFYAGIVAEFPEITETIAAARIVDGLRQQPVWGKILKGNAN
jgi:hypothetical protein